MNSTDARADERVFELTRAELDALPYGVITLDRRGKILRFNYAEAALARRDSNTTIGLNFFADVAPCTNVQGFKGRFDSFALGRDSGVDRFDFSFAFRWGRQDVTITLLRKAEHEEINLLVRRRTMETLDLPLPTPEEHRSNVEAVRGNALPAPAPLAASAQRLEPAPAWTLGTREEDAWRAHIHPDDRDATLAIVRDASSARRSYGVEYRIVRSGRAVRNVREYGTFEPRANARGSAMAIDVTEWRRSESELWQLARYDSLTGLPNRHVLLERIGDAAAAANESGRVAAILALAVSRFDAVNETFGRETGEELLRLLALRMGESVRGGDTVARLEGERFIVLLTDVDGAAGALATAERILAHLSENFSLHGRTHRLCVRVGMSSAPANGTDAAALLQAAETALSAAIREARSGIARFSSDMALTAVKDFRTESELRAAVARGEFELYYQPIVDFGRRRIVAAEALVRWNHPERGLVAPGDFIAVAERTGAMLELGPWVIRTACRQARAWHDRGLDLGVCVNVSAVQFREPGFAESVTALLDETGVPAHALELELTESMMIDGFGEVVDTLGKLKVAGVRLSVDDFGTGYSSLAYLKYFPIDTLKLDRAFVADIAVDSFDRAIAKAVLTLANELKLHCIAEGIELREQADLLFALGCRRMQGYYFGRPQPSGAFPVTLDIRG